MAGSAAEPPLRLYEGVVTHRRNVPTLHMFRRRIWMPMVDLDRIAGMRGLWPLLSIRYPAVLRHRRSDFGGAGRGPNRDARSLASEIRDLVEDRLGERPLGSVELLAHMRTWGWLFNPLAVYYCHNPEGALLAAVLEVTNTPWGERHQYVVDLRGGEGHANLAKQMHVSPFLPMDVRYDIRVTAPGERCVMSIAVRQGETVLFSAAMSLRRSAFNRRRLLRLLLRQPFPTHGVSAGIYAHAGRLWRKRVPYVPRAVVAQVSAGS